MEIGGDIARNIFQNISMSFSVCTAVFSVVRRSVEIDRTARIIELIYCANS